MAVLERTHERRRRDEPRDGGQEEGARDRLNVVGVRAATEPAR